MGTDKTDPQSLVDNLKDAGCEPETVILFLKLHEEDNANGQLCLLAEHRKKLLEEIHREQTKLDCLDYLLYHMRKKQAVYQR